MWLRQYLELFLYFLNILLVFFSELASAGPESPWRRDLLHHTHHISDFLLEVDGLRIMELGLVDCPDFIHQFLLVRNKLIRLWKEWFCVGRPQSICVILLRIQFIRAASFHKVDLIVAKILMAILQLYNLVELCAVLIWFFASHWALFLETHALRKELF